MVGRDDTSGINDQHSGPAGKWGPLNEDVMSLLLKIRDVIPAIAMLVDQGG